MRFVTFYGIGGSLRPGFLSADGSEVVDPRHEGGPGWATALPPSLLEWVELGLPALAARLVARDYPAAARWPLTQVRLAAPLPRPGKIVGAAFNFHDALRERGMAPPAEPVLFVKSGRTVVGPRRPVRLQRGGGNGAYEAGLGLEPSSAEMKKAWEEESKEGRVLRSERQYGHASRSFTLASAVDESKADARYENGILELTLPKKGAAATKRLSIH